MIQSTLIFVWMLPLLAFNINSYVHSSSTSYNTDRQLVDHKQRFLSSTVLVIRGGSNTTSPTIKPRIPNKSSVTFLYELHEHEIYNPQTSSWASRRFTQSPITGGGGRDSTSLDPSSCTPPRNYCWDGEWKIDMTGEMRDGFGWEYYVGKFDGLGRRRRRWVRNLRRIVSESDVPRERVQKANVTKGSLEVDETTISPTLWQAIIDQYSFKGFGWTFSKSLLWKRSVGATFRVPLSSNFMFLDRYAAIPFASWTSYFGYPWVIATFLNASVPLEVLEWIIGGVLWKIKWTFAIASAIVRSVIEAAVWIVFTPLRTWMTFRQVVSNLARKRSKSSIARSLIDSIDADDQNDDDSTKPLNSETKDGEIDGLIELSTASAASQEISDLSPVSTSAVVSSPRGGAFSKTPRTQKRFKTILGHDVPTFHRRTDIEYSSIISQRVGFCVSWRVSQERGYEYRWNFWCSFLPTQECWEHFDKVITQKITTLRRLASKERKAVDEYEAAPLPSIVKAFLYDHSATLGLTSGYPLPVEPFFALSLILSMSGFYYGWLIKYIASKMCLQRPQHISDVEEINSGSEEERNTKRMTTNTDSFSIDKKKRNVEKDA